MKIKPNFTDNTTVFRPKFRVESPTPTVKPETENPYLKIKTEKSFPANFGEVYVVKENVEPAYGKVQIGDIIYDSLDSALEAVKSGDTIILQSDINYKAPLSFTTDFRLDLNGYTLTADGVAILAHGGSIVDNGATKGLLAVPKGLLVMSHAVYGMLPVWNEEGTGYIFVKVIDQKKPIVIIDENSFVVECRPSISGGGVTTSKVFSDGALDNEISFRINITGYDESGNIIQTVVLPPLTDELVSSVYTNSTSFKYTINGMRYAKCVVEMVIETESGLVYRSELGTVET